MSRESCFVATVATMSISQPLTSEPVPAPATPHLLVTVVPLRLGEKDMEVAVLNSAPGSASLIKDLPFAAESLDLAARRIERERLGDQGDYLEQLYTFNRLGQPEGDVVVGHISLFRRQRSQGEREDVTWTSIQAVEFDDDLDRVVLDYARMRLRAKLGYTNIAFHLLPDAFTLTELQHAYERVLGHPVDKRNFRRRMTAAGVLEHIHRTRRDGSHRPAALYRFITQDDHAAYLTPSWAAHRGTDESRPALENPGDGTHGSGDTARS